MATQDYTPLPMDLAELREVARKVEAIIDAGKLDRLREVFSERTGYRLAHHDGQRYWPTEPTAARQAENDLHQSLKNGTIKYRLPVIEALTDLLNVPEEQAIAAAVELNVSGNRAAALKLIDEAYRTITTQRRAS